MRGLGVIDGEAGAPTGTGEVKSSDAQIVEALRRGDDATFARVVDQYSHRLRGMCFRYLRDEHLAEDVVQETLLRLLEHLPRVDENLNLSAWLHRIATNLCLDELRRRSRASRWHESSDEDHESLLVEVVDDDRRGQPEHAYDDGLTRRHLEAAAQRLPARQWAVLARDLSNMSQADTALAFGITVSAVQGILFRARERFRAEYVEILGEDHRPAECATVAFTIENVSLNALRLDRLKAIRRHLKGCAQCTLQFGAAVSRCQSGEFDEAVAV